MKITHFFRNVVLIALLETARENKTKSKKYHAGADIQSNDITIESNKSSSISVNNPVKSKLAYINAKSLQYAMKRSRINNLLK